MLAHNPTKGWTEFPFSVVFTPLCKVKLKILKFYYYWTRVILSIFVTFILIGKQRLSFMPYTTEEGGRLNNFARETKTYYAEPPTNTQKRNYALLGVAATILVSGLIFIAYSASNLG